MTFRLHSLLGEHKCPLCICRTLDQPQSQRQEKAQPDALIFINPGNKKANAQVLSAVGEEPQWESLAAAQGRKANGHIIQQLHPPVRNQRTRTQIPTYARSLTTGLTGSKGWERTRHSQSTQCTGTTGHMRHYPYGKLPEQEREGVASSCQRLGEEHGGGWLFSWHWSLTWVC